MTLKAPVICIDGPSGSGKGTLARNLASELGFSYMDSGALYRILAVLSQRMKIDANDVKALSELAAHISVRFENDQVLLDGEDLSPEVRLETTASLASELAAFPEVRTALVESQRAYAQPPGLIADGRDMGTVIFPDAPLKIYLVASAEERAKRRLQQLEELEQKNGQIGGENNANQLIHKDLNDSERGGRLRALVNEIEARDERDMSRETSPLRPADDAVMIDCTSMSIDEVFQKVLALWQQQAG